MSDPDWSEPDIKVAIVVRGKSHRFADDSLAQVKFGTLPFDLSVGADPADQCATGEIGYR